jgi:hypothetical protein
MKQKPSDGMTVKAVWHIVKESARSIGGRSWRPTICDGPVLGSARIGRRVRADPVSPGARFGANDRTLPWLQAADSITVNDRIGIEPNS